ncbi:MAG: hypothetical protein HQK49_10255 [Oligoflexia bacterium]|nr:hypothetical protein [Oligoflexia bacterium]
MIKLFRIKNFNKRYIVLFTISFLFISLFIKTNTGGWNDKSRLATIESLVENKTLIIDQSIFFNNTLDKVFINGHYYSDKPPLLSIFLFPIYLFIHNTFNLNLSNNTPPSNNFGNLNRNPFDYEFEQIDPKAFPSNKEYIRATISKKCRDFYNSENKNSNSKLRYYFLPEKIEITLYLLLLLSNGFIFALIVVFISKLISLFVNDYKVNLILTLFFTLGTYIFPYSLILNNHIYTTFLTLLLIYYLLLIKLKINESKIKWQFLLIGIILGLIIAIEISPLISMVPLVIIYLLSYKNYRRWSYVITFITGLLIPLSIHLAFNFYIAGDFKPINMHPEFFNYPGTAFNKYNLSGVSFMHKSLSDFFYYTYDSFLGKRGLFLFCPTLLLCLFVAIHSMIKNQNQNILKEKFLSLAIIVATSIQIILFTNHHGGGCFSFRHLIFLTPLFLFLIIPELANVYQNSKSSLMLLLKISSAISIIFMFLAVYNPWASTNGILELFKGALNSPLIDFIPIMHIFLL